MNKLHSRSLLLGGCAALAVHAPTAWAQHVQPTDNSDGQVSTVDEIIVTAQRRNQRLQDVPVTVTVFGAEQIQNARIQTIQDIVTRTPGLSFDAFPSGQPRPFIRGIGSSDRGAAGDPSSAVFVDEIYMGRPAAVSFDSSDVQQIEVLKGPQGTLYGRNVVGGAVSVTTTRPSLDSVSGSLEGTIGNYGTYEGAGVVNLPLADGTAAIRASASVRTRDGYYSNTFTGNRLDDQDSRSARLQFLAQPSDRLRVHLTVDGTRDRANGPAQFALGVDPGSSRAVLWTPNQNRRQNASEYDGYQDRDVWGVRAQVDYDLGFANLIYLGSYRDLDYASSYDFDGGNPTFNRAGISLTNAEQTQFWSNELRLASPDSSPINWVAGLYQFSQRVDRQDLIGLYNRASLTAPVPAPPPTDRFDQTAALDSFAAYADVTVPLGDRFKVFGGVRYSKDDKDFSISNLLGTALLRSTERYAASVSDSFDAVTWRLGLDFQPSPDHLFYGKISRGFKSGGFQDTPGTEVSARTPFNPEYATQYEIGQKSQFFDRRVTWNNTLYYTDYTDLQTRQVVGLAVVTSNAGAATIQGYETSFNWQATDGLRFDLSYAYTDATFDVYVENGVDFSGNRISRTPEHKLVFSPSYTWAIGNGAELALSADYQYESFIFDDNENNDLEVREPTEFIDARLVFTDPTGRWQASVWGKNLTDEVSRTFQTTFYGGLFGAFTPPRTYGATVRWKY